MQITNISNFNIAQSVKVTVDTMSFTVIVTVKYTAFLLILHSETMFSCYIFGCFFYRSTRHNHLSGFHVSYN